jgi:hypothetical protein
VLDEEKEYTKIKYQEPLFGMFEDDDEIEDTTSYNNHYNEEEELRQAI